MGLVFAMINAVRSASQGYIDDDDPVGFVSAVQQNNRVIAQYDGLGDFLPLDAAMHVTHPAIAVSATAVGLLFY
jgi:hypothetical protein